MKGYFPIFAIMLYCGRWWLGWFDPFKTSWNDARMEKTITAFHCIPFWFTLLVSFSAWAQTSEPASSNEGGDIVMQLTENELAAAKAESNPEKSSAPVSAGLIKVAVYPMDLENIPEVLGNIVSESVLDEVRKLEGVSAIGMDEITKMLSLEAQKQVVGCDESESCLAEIAGALGVDEIITGRLTEAADGRIFLLRRINQRKASIIQTVTKRLHIGSGEEFLLATGSVIYELYPKRTNRPGTSRGVPDEIALRLNPPPVPTWVTWTSVGLSAAALATSAAFYGMAAEKNAFYNTTAWEGTNTQPGEDLRDAYEAGHTFQSVGAGALITGATMALTSIVMTLFTDWEGYASNDESN